jgi:hypothetical protein
MQPTQNKLTTEQSVLLLSTLQNRFENNRMRHPDLAWSTIQARLDAHPEKLGSLYQMEISGGEPDVVGYDPTEDAYLFFDCVPESPSGRRNFCYDRQALNSRKENKPTGDAVSMAESMGITLLTTEQYHTLQQFGAFDIKTSSWLQTPVEIRKRGGAIFGDRRYDHVFIYHNGAQSYYAARGFRGALQV